MALGYRKYGVDCIRYLDWSKLSGIFIFDLFFDVRMGIYAWSKDDKKIMLSLKK